MTYPTKYLFLLVCFLIIQVAIFPQEEKTSETQRPKIGLVLSGGGAKGIAHIGILKAMEKEGIRPDYITGTSMGSIIGGLYALGYSADQLDTIIRQIDWGEVLSNNIQLQYVAYEEKEYYNRYLIELPFKEGKLKLPSGVIHSQMLGEMLARYCWPAKNYSSFDEFPIPFRCIATDVGTGKEIVFKDGSLAMALRASMAIPTAFTPVDLDSTLAVDGGVVNNFPVEEVIDMGADIVIGVSVGDGLKPAEELSGMTDILFQISMIPSLTRLKDQIEQCEIYIRPDLKDNGTASFSNYKEILELGDAAGEKVQPEFKLNPLPKDNTYRLTIKTIEKTPTILKGTVHYDNIFKMGVVMNLTLRNLLGKSSRTIIAGDISENPKLRVDYLKYIGLRQRIAVNFRYDYLNEKIPSYEAGLLKDVDVSYKHNFTLGFITTQSLRNSLLIGATYQLNTQKQKFSSIIPEGVKHGNFNTLKGELIFTANTFNDRNYPTKGRELSVGIQSFFYNDYKIVYDKGIDTVYIDDILPLSENDFNNLIVDPLTPDIYGMVQFKFHSLYQLNKKFQIVPIFSSGVTLSTDSIGLFQNFKLGGNQRVRYGDTRFIGLNYAEVNYENYALLGLFLQNVLFQKIYLKYGANLLLPYDYVPLNDLDQFDINTLIDDNSMLGYGVEATYKSFLGPISLGISRNSRDPYFRYYLAIGFSFNYSD